MTIAFGTVGAAASGIGGSITPALPASTAANDFLLAVVNVQTATSMGARGDGWTLIGTPVANAEAPNFLLHVYWKFAGASESAPTFSSSGAAVMVGVIARWTGVPVGPSPFNIAATSHQGSGTTMAGNTATTTVDGCMAIWIWGQDDNGVTAAVTNSATVAFGGASYNVTVGGGTNASAAYKLITTHGSTGATNMTSASGTQNMHMLIVLDPTPTAAGLPPLLQPEATRLRHLLPR